MRFLTVTTTATLAATSLLMSSAALAESDDQFFRAGGFFSESKVAAPAKSSPTRGQFVSRTTTKSVARTSGDFVHPVPNAKGRTRGIIPGVHYGVDIAASVGSTVLAATGGEVVRVEYGSGGGEYGKLVVVKSGGAESYYAHLSAISVTVGTSVSAGQKIGLAGNTGNARGAHLHFEVRGGSNPL